MDKDRLDGSKRSNLLFELYALPGRAILWIQYMNPQKGEIRQSARRAKSPMMTFLYATGFWIALTCTLLFLTVKITKPEKLSQASENYLKNHSIDNQKKQPLAAIPVTDEELLDEQSFQNIGKKPSNLNNEFNGVPEVKKDPTAPSRIPHRKW